MRTITVYLENDADSARIMKALNNTEFEGTIEAYEMDVDIPEEDLETFEELLDNYHDEPTAEDSYLNFKNDVAEKFDIGYLQKIK